MANKVNGKKKATVWYSKGDPQGTKVAKNQTYRESAVQKPTSKKQRRGF